MDHAELIAYREAEQLVLQVNDQGVGFVPEALEGDYGLSNMRERLRLIGGRLILESEPGEGTRATIIVPIPNSGRN